MLLSIDDSGTYMVWSVTPDSKDVRRLYSDALPISAMCSSPTTGVLYRSASETPRKSGETAALRRTGARAGPHERPSDAVPHHCDVSADGARLLSTRGSGHANIWRLDLRGLRRRRHRCHGIGVVIRCH